MPSSSPRPPKDTDVASTTARLRAIVLLVAPVSCVAIIVLALTGNLGAHALWLVPVVLLGCGLLGWTIHLFAERTAQGFLRTLLSEGGDAHAHDFSGQDALVMQGRADDAIASYEAHLAHAPRDVEAHLRFAALLARDPVHAARAVELYLAARALGPSPRQEAALSNALIDLHRASGDRERLKAELARFARRHERSVEGQRAREYLRRLVREDHA